MTTKPHKKSNFEWLKSIQGWQKAIFVSITSTFTLWIMSYAINHISSRADVKLINIQDVKFLDKCKKDSLATLEINKNITQLKLSQSVIECKVDDVIKTQDSGNKILMQILLTLSGVKKACDINKTYSDSRYYINGKAKNIFNTDSLIHFNNCGSGIINYSTK